jgi:predicted amidohydrolase
MTRGIQTFDHAKEFQVMRIKIVQLAVGRNPHDNLQKMLEHLSSAQENEWVVFPEAMLSGYAPEVAGYLSDIAPEQIEAAMDAISDLAVARSCHAVFGAATQISGRWYNSVHVRPATQNQGAPITHQKRELSHLDQRHFLPGEQPKVFTKNGVTFGLQACRELLFPETWQRLKREGAQIIFHLNNALQAKDAIWEHILISRAVENGMFVCSVNNAAAPQSLGSYLITPTGELLLNPPPQIEIAVSAHFDLADVVPDLSRRTDF